MGPAHIGTSGWHYQHWRGPFYPEDMPASKFLQFYAQRFHSVEINNSFYRLPGETALRDWKSTAPRRFLFAVKASRFITHMKKLKEAGASFQKFFDRIVVLGEALGPVLFQLPPRWGPDPGRLDEFLTGLPRNLRYAFELRDPSWFNPEVNAVLKKHRAAFCIYEFDRLLSPKTITANFVYIRLHGPEGAYRGLYGKRRLEPWAREIQSWRKAGKTVYCYFDNDQAGFAARDALMLQDLVSQGE